MKLFLTLLIKSIPLAIGIIFSLISVAFTVTIANGSDSSDAIFTAIFTGIIGYPLIIASAMSLIKNCD